MNQGNWDFPEIIYRIKRLFNRCGRFDTVWDDIILNPSNLRGGVSVPNFSVFAGGIYQLLFLNTQSDEVYGSFELPHDYKEGTALYPHIHWSPSSTNTGNAVWQFEYVMESINGTFGSPVTLTITQAGAGVALAHQLAETNIPIPGTNRKIGDICLFRLGRATGDAFTGDAFLHSVGIHYEIDKVGSDSKLVKNA